MNGLRYVNWLKGEKKFSPREVKSGRGTEIVKDQQLGLKGFSVDPRAYLEFLSFNGLFREIRALLTGVNMESASDLWGQSAAIRQLIMRTSSPKHIAEELAAACEQLTSSSDRPDLSLSVCGAVIVTADELSAERLADKHDPYVITNDPGKVIWHVKRCWARLWTPRAIYCREQLGCQHLDALPVVTVEVTFPKEAAIA